MLTRASAAVVAAMTMAWAIVRAVRVVLAGATRFVMAGAESASAEREKNGRMFTGVSFIRDRGRVTNC